MPEVRANRTKVKAPTVAEVVAFKGVTGATPHFPEDVHEQVRRGIASKSRSLMKHAPPGIVAAFAYSSASWKRPLRAIELTVISTVSQWKTIERVTSVPSEDNIIEPAFDVYPIRHEEWEVSTEHDGPAYRHAKGRGILAYSSENEG
jgi:hypothetical protein